MHHDGTCGTGWNSVASGWVEIWHIDDEQGFNRVLRTPSTGDSPRDPNAGIRKLRRLFPGTSVSVRQNNGKGRMTAKWATDGNSVCDK